MNRPEPPPIVRPIPQGIPVAQAVVVQAAQPIVARPKRDPLLKAMRWVTIAWAVGLPLVWVGGIAWNFLSANHLGGGWYRVEGSVFSREAFVALIVVSRTIDSLVLTAIYAVTMIVLFVMHKTR